QKQAVCLDSSGAAFQRSPFCHLPGGVDRNPYPSGLPAWRDRARPVFRGRNDWSRLFETKPKFHRYRVEPAIRQDRCAATGSITDQPKSGPGRVWYWGTQANLESGVALDESREDNPETSATSRPAFG